MNMYAETPRRLLITGSLGADDLRNLTNYCHQLHVSGQIELHLDLSAVTACDRDALGALLALANGCTALTISIDGVRWDQFRGLLAETPTAEVGPVCDDVRTLLADRVPRRRRAAGRRRAPRASADAAERSISSSSVPRRASR